MAFTELSPTLTLWYTWKSCSGCVWVTHFTTGTSKQFLAGFKVWTVISRTGRQYGDPRIYSLLLTSIYLPPFTRNSETTFTVSLSAFHVWYFGKSSLEPGSSVASAQLQVQTYHKRLSCIRIFPEGIKTQPKWLHRPCVVPALVGSTVLKKCGSLGERGCQHQ